MFSASDIKLLREHTGAGMLDCKKALTENNGDMDKAIDWLREKGTIKAAKKEGRIAAEGLTKIVANDKEAVIVEVNSETDFVAKNALFISAIDQIANAILNSQVSSLESANELIIDGETISTMMINLTAKIGEKLSFRRFTRVSKTDNQVFGTYSHMGGKIGVITLLEGGDSSVAKDIAMHIAAMKPTYIKREDVDQEVIDRESKVIKEQAINEGKPAEIASKMVAGRIGKFYKEICLNEQDFVKDSDITVLTYANNNKAVVLSMVRFEVGEGIEKRQDDFAREVMNQING
ncbi:MAG: translation elongation factor Ts [Bacilli bacterium]